MDQRLPQTPTTVYVVDDDSGVRHALAFALEPIPHRDEDVGRRNDRLADHDIGRDVLRALARERERLVGRAEMQGEVAVLLGTREVVRILRWRERQQRARPLDARSTRTKRCKR